MQEEYGQDDQELTFTETADDLKVLIVYCRSISIKPWDWRKQRETTVSEMFSFGEPTAVELCRKYPRGGCGYCLSRTTMTVCKGRPVLWESTPEIQ